MKIAFYAPMKSLNYPKPSGDQAIARDLVQFFAQSGQEYFELSEFRAIRFWQSAGKLWRFPWEFLRAFFRAWRARPDIFFTYHLYHRCPDPLSPFLSCIFRKPYVVYEASFAEKARKSWKTKPGYYLTKFALARAKYIFCNMSDDYHYLQRYFGAEKLFFIPPSIDVNYFTFSASAAELARKKFALAADRVRILCVAMFRDARKSAGIALLLRALTEVRSQGIENFELAIVGDGIQRLELEQYAQENLPGKIKFLGVQPRADLVGLYSQADFFAFPGIDEGFGLVYIEAQACGLPVVALHNGGIPDAVAAGETAILTPLGDDQAYAQALRKLVEDPGLRARMRVQAREYVVAHHDRQKNYQGFLKRLQEL